MSPREPKGVASNSSANAKSTDQTTRIEHHELFTDKKIEHGNEGKAHFDLKPSGGQGGEHLELIPGIRGNGVTNCCSDLVQHFGILDFFPKPSLVTGADWVLFVCQ